MTNLCGSCFRETLNASGVCTACGFDGAKNREKYPLALPPGAILNGRYIIGRVLGQGGFGITYTARDHQTGGIVAIKEFFPDSMATRTSHTTVTPLTGEKGENFAYGKNTFLNEAKTMAEFIGNPNIVRVYSYFEENGTGYFVMEYVDGRSFQEILKENFGRVSWEEALKILLPVMDALTAVHEKGIIHRDIAPDNICIARDGTVKLLDFGAARYSLGNVSQSLDVVLRHGFAPKEQYKRHGRQGPYTDIYALGATLYYAITGSRPDDAIERLDEDTLPLPSTLGARVTIEQENVILKAMAIQPENRYQTIAEFKTALLMPQPEFIPQYVPERRKLENIPKREEKPEVQSEAEKSKAKKTEKKLNKEKKKLPQVLIGITAAVVIAVGGFLMIENSYKSANAMMEQGRYEDAAQCFEKLSFYKDSELQRQEAMFVWSEELLEQNQYDLALEKLAEIPEHEKTENQLRKVYYQRALSYAKDANYEKAYVEFEMLADYQDAATQKSIAAMNWAREILNNANETEAERFTKTVKNLNSMYMQHLYTYIGTAKYTGYKDIETVKKMLSCVQNDIPEAKAMNQTLNGYKSDSYVLDSREELEALWNVPYIRKVVQDDYHIAHWLRGNWKAKDGSYIRFFNDDDDPEATTTKSDLPKVEKPKGTKYYNIKDMIYVWEDKDGNELAKVFRFELTDDVDTMKVYCYKDGETYTLKRS